MLAPLKRWESVETKSPQMALIRKRLRVEMWMYDQVRGYHHLVWFSIVCILYHHHNMWFYIFSSSSRLSTLRKGRQKLRLTSMRYNPRDDSTVVMLYPLNLYKRCMLSTPNFQVLDIEDDNLRKKFIRDILIGSKSSREVINVSS